MNKKIAQNLINKTKDDYNKIAHHFASTRKYNWPILKTLLSDIAEDKNFKFVDLGCGAGRIYELVGEKIDYTGIDLSDDLIAIAKKKYPEGKFMVGNILETPFNDNKFDMSISVATLHHIPGKENRQKALNEIYRITKPGGEVVITNWYFWDKPEYLKEIIKESFRKITGKSKLDFGDFNMPWKSVHKNVITERYFHAWTKRETIKLLKNAGFTEIKNLSETETEQKRNLITVCKKPL